MQPVVEPQPRVFGDRIGLEVDQQDAEPVGLGADDRVQLVHPFPQACRERVDCGRVGHGEGRHGAARPSRLAEDDDVLRPDQVEVAARPDHVVHPGEDGE